MSEENDIMNVDDAPLLELHLRITNIWYENKELRRILNKAKIALSSWNPSDHWFPHIEQEFSELMDEIHNILKNKGNGKDILVKGEMK